MCSSFLYDQFEKERIVKASHVKQTYNRGVWQVGDYQVILKSIR